MKLWKLFENRYTRRAEACLVKTAAKYGTTRRLMNAVYLRLDLRGLARFHRHAGLFRDGACLRDGQWTIRFGGRDIITPLRRESAWLDWDFAVSLLGHDPEVKQTYAALLASALKPDLFVDIGANFGTHSLLFAAAGVRVIAFEPNPACADYMRDLFAANGVAAQLEPIALGRQAQEIALQFPRGEAWLGTVEPKVAARLEDQGKQMQSVRVSMRTLDDYLSDLGTARVLVKIDVEGAENSVLRGAGRVLNDLHPLVILESNDSRMRSQTADILAGFGYRLARLPFNPSTNPSLLSVDEFVNSPATNFLALPPDQPTARFQNG